MKSLNVTEPSLPPLEEFLPYLEKIWASKILTNGGSFHGQLEEELCKYLGVSYISLFNNGTIALITALKALDLSGEVITTPYSFVATSNALSWLNIKPVFIDIDPETLNLDPIKIESAITPATTAILGVHCYGTPCNVEEIQEIASKNNLKVVYDAAHAFGIKYKGESILKFGDLSILSFHATKVFNTFEGGAIISKTLEDKLKIDKLKNFGFENETSVTLVGINGKMSEINAAFGILQLQHIDKWILNRKLVHDYYKFNLKNVKGINFPKIDEFSNQNYSYFPILVNHDYSLTRDELYIKLKRNGINGRRYFFPLISELKPYKNLNERFKNALDASSKILCLPIHPNLGVDEIDRVIKVIHEK